MRDRTNKVKMSADGETLSVTDARVLSTLQRIGEMANLPHFGTFGGLATRVLYFVFGAILSAMSLSGVYISSARIRKAQRRPARGAKLPSSPPAPEAAG